jgi:hypothetical protein
MALHGDSGHPSGSHRRIPGKVAMRRWDDAPSHSGRGKSRRGKKRKYMSMILWMQIL